MIDILTLIDYLIKKLNYYNMNKLYLYYETVLCLASAKTRWIFLTFIVSKNFYCMGVS